MERPESAKRAVLLTARERQVLELIWAGFKNKEIGRQLKISVKTVEVHRSSMNEKDESPQHSRTVEDGSC
jgi:DNA-binding NarL/FixJ family response regulator